MRSCLALLLFFAACTADNPNFRPTDGFVSSDGLIIGGGDGGAVDLTKPPGPKPDLTGEIVDLADPADGFFNCVDEGAACGFDATTAGLCKSAVCSKCDGPADDGLCSLAYGGDRICVAGSCVPGNCHTSADCLGKLCVGTLCVSCNSDFQCKNDPVYGDQSFCGDAGLCETDACPPAEGNVYYVDPINGSDFAGTGNGSDGCAFRTISHAVAVLPSNAPAGTTVIVVGDDPFGETLVDASETYPIVIQTNVTVTIEDNTGDIKLAPAAKFVFTVTGKGARLGGSSTGRFLIDGSNAPAGEAAGINSQNGSGATIDHVRITNFDGNNGVGLQVVSGATITAGEEVEISGCGNGIRVSGRNSSGPPQIGHLIVSHPDALDGEGLYVHDNVIGLSVTGLGYATLLGDATTQTIRFVANSTAGIAIAQNASNSTSTNAIDGVVVRGPGTAGISVVFGSKFKLRRSETLEAETGLALTSGIGSVVAPNPADIDLGTGGDPGRNTFQYPGLSNSTVGICVVAGTAPSAEIRARGNVWNAIDCVTSNPGTLVGAQNNACSGGVDVGYQVFAGPALDKVYDVANCDLP